MTWRGPDARRPLSDKGRKQAKRLGTQLAAVRADLGPILTSPKLRASETADLLAKSLGTSVTVEHRLAGALDVATLEAILAGHGDPERVVLVGHDPDFSAVLGQLIGLRELPMRKGEIARVEIGRPLAAGSGVLRWLLPPELLKT